MFRYTKSFLVPGRFGAYKAELFPAEMKGLLCCDGDVLVVYAEGKGVQTSVHVCEPRA